MGVSVPRYTVDDLERFPDDGNRYELLDGVLLVTTAPAARHQIVANRLQVQLSIPLVPTKIAHVVGPGVVVRKPNTQLQPDVLVYPARFSPTTDWPKIDDQWLAIEVLSRSSRIYDREFKRDAYLALGVREVWLVDLRAKTVEVSRTRGAVKTVSDVIRWRVPGKSLIVTIDLAAVFAGLP